MKTKITSLRTLAIASALTFAAGAVNAAIPLFSSHPNPTGFPDGGLRFLPLTPGGATVLPFTSAGLGQKNLIIYTAECGIGSLDRFSWFQVLITVDGIPRGPSGDRAFCTGDGTGLGANWATHSTNFVVSGLAAGVHILQVSGQLMNFNAGDFAEIDDSTTVIVR